MTIHIRAYRKSDVREASDIWNEVVEEGNAFPQEEPLSLEEADDFFLSQSYTGIAEDTDSGQILGLYILHPNNVGRCGHICNASYAVAREDRGEHIGEKLVKDCMEQAKKEGYRILQFNAVVADNKAALHLYEKLGFTRLGVIPGGFRGKDGEYKDIIPHYCIL